MVWGTAYKDEGGEPEVSGMSLAERISETLSGLVDEHLVKVRETNWLMVKIAGGEVSVIQSWRKSIVDIYVAKDARIGMLSFEATGVEDAVKRIPSLLSVLKPSPFYAPLPEPTGKPLSSTDEKIIEIVRSGEVADRLGELGVDELGNAAGKIDFAYRETRLIGSSGVDLGYRSTSFNGYMRVFREGRSGQWSWTSTKYDAGLARRALEKAVELAEECAKLPRERVEPGRYRVLISPMVAGNLIGDLVGAASAGMLIFGMSFLQGRKPGERVLSPRLTVIDKPLDTSLPGFSGFDDEGVATSNKPIFEEGVFKGFLHNSKTAKLLKAETTGNAGWIMPRPFNLEVAEGDMKPGEMMEMLGDGLYLTNNWYTRFQNYLEGRFSTVSRDAAFVVKGGKPKACVERVRIADLMPRLFSSVEAVGSDPWQIEWWEVRTPTRIPHILLGEAGITLPS